MTCVSHQWEPDPKCPSMCKHCDHYRSCHPAPVPPEVRKLHELADMADLLGRGRVEMYGIVWTAVELREMADAIERATLKPV